MNIHLINYAAKNNRVESTFYKHIVFVKYYSFVFPLMPPIRAYFLLTFVLGVVYAFNNGTLDESLIGDSESDAIDSDSDLLLTKLRNPDIINFDNPTIKSANDREALLMRLRNFDLIFDQENQFDKNVTHQGTD